MTIWKSLERDLQSFFRFVAVGVMLLAATLAALAFFIFHLHGKSAELEACRSGLVVEKARNRLLQEECDAKK